MAIDKTMKTINKILVNFNAEIKFIKFKRKLNQLINDGLKIGRNVTIMPNVIIDDKYPYLISIGDNCSFSNGVLILAHDATTFKFTGGYSKVAKVEIKDNVYVGQNSIILPGITIGSNVLVAAGSVVNKNIPENSCVAGVPARVYAKFDEFIENHKHLIDERSFFEYKDFSKPNVEFKEKIKKLVENGHIYVKGYEGKFPWTVS